MRSSLGYNLSLHSRRRLAELFCRSWHDLPTDQHPGLSSAGQSERSRAFASANTLKRPEVDNIPPPSGSVRGGKNFVGGLSFRHRVCCAYCITSGHVPESSALRIGPTATDWRTHRVATATARTAGSRSSWRRAPARTRWRTCLAINTAVDARGGRRRTQTEGCPNKIDKCRPLVKGR